MPLVGLELLPDSTQETPIPHEDDAHSDALSGVSPSPALSLLVKLTASLTADERAVLARLLGQGEGEAARAAS
jgi:hypothetical protein